VALTTQTDLSATEAASEAAIATAKEVTPAAAAAPAPAAPAAPAAAAAPPPPSNSVTTTTAAPTMAEAAKPSSASAHPIAAEAPTLTATTSHAKDTATAAANLAPKAAPPAKAPDQAHDVGHASKGSTHLPLSKGYLQAGPYQIREAQIPEGCRGIHSVAALIQAVQSRCANTIQLSDQTALRFLLGCNLDVDECVRRAQGLAQWRNANNMDGLRRQLSEVISTSRAATAPGTLQHLPHHAEVNKLVTLNPCCLIAMNGCPVSIWHVGSATASAVSSVRDDALRAWSRSTFEFVDIWLTEQSDLEGRLAGHIQIFNLTGISFWQLSNTALIDKLKLIFSAGEHYLEAVSHIYVINSSSLFTMGWKLIKGFLSPRTASKLCVDSGLPKDLLAALGPAATQQLKGLLDKPRGDVPLLYHGISDPAAVHVRTSGAASGSQFFS